MVHRCLEWVGVMGAEIDRRVNRSGTSELGDWSWWYCLRGDFGAIWGERWVRWLLGGWLRGGCYWRRLL